MERCDRISQRLSVHSTTCPFVIITDRSSRPDSSSDATINSLQSRISTTETTLVGCLFIISFIHCFRVLLLDLRDGVTCRLSRQTGTSVQMFSLKYSCDLLHSLCCHSFSIFWRTIYVCAVKKFTLNDFGVFWTLADAATFHTFFAHTRLPKKEQEVGTHKRIPKSGQFLKVQEFNCLYYSFPG